jgi:hypothetical protein
MNNRDETIRDKLLDRLAAVGVDARSLALEVVNGTVIVRGAVPSEEQRQRAMDALIGVHSLEIAIRRGAPSDSDDGRGRSPVTGTSAESAHYSRRQTDPT